MQYFDHITVSH